MARPIPLNVPPGEPRAGLEERLEQAPAANAEALLEAYEVLRLLHDRGVLDLVRGMLGSGERLLAIGVDAAKGPESIRGLRNLALLIKMLGGIDPVALGTVTQTIPRALDAVAQQSESPGVWTLLSGFRKPEVRRGMAALQAMLAELGRGLDSTKGAAGADGAAPPAA